MVIREPVDIDEFSSALVSWAEDCILPDSLFRLCLSTERDSIYRKKVVHYIPKKSAPFDRAFNPVAIPGDLNIHRPESSNELRGGCKASAVLRERSELMVVIQQGLAIPVVAFEYVRDAKEAEALRIKYLGKKGIINDLMADFRNVPADQKKEVGMKLNELKNKAQEKINALKEAASAQDHLADDLDLTRTAYPIALGTRHPLTIVKNEIVDIFSRLGFTLAEGPEVEDDWHVYSSMNFADDHPARDMQDTFFVEAHPDIVLRSHTSSVQARVMERQQPPIRVICPGRVYRNEAISARAHCFFHQVEGLYVDRNVSFTDLKQVLLLFAQEMFGKETKIRLRPSYFPFTEPSAEMDISCDICGGKGCSFCKHTGWVEILGCGMVDPAVLDANGIDSKIYTGYAFGMGIERITNLKYKVKDLRMFSENDLRFLEEFKSAN